MNLWAVSQWYVPNHEQAAWFLAGIVCGKILKSILDKMGV